MSGFSAGFSFEEDDEPVIPPTRPPPPSQIKIDLTNDEDVDDTPAPSAPSPQKSAHKALHSLAISSPSPSTPTPPPAPAPPTKPPLALPSKGAIHSASHTKSNAGSSQAHLLHNSKHDTNNNNRLALPLPAPTPPSSSNQSTATPTSTSNGFSKYAGVQNTPSIPATSSVTNSSIKQQPHHRPSSSSSFYPHPSLQQQHSPVLNSDTSHSTSFNSSSTVPPHPQQRTQSLGRVPIINSATSARLPSSFLMQQHPASTSKPSIINSSAPLSHIGATAAHHHNQRAQTLPHISHHQHHQQQQQSSQPQNDYYKLQSAQVAAAINAATAGARQSSSSRQSSTSSFHSQPPQPSFNSPFSPATMDKGKGKQSSSAAEVVDLTTLASDDDSDSDEVIIDETPVCIGQIVSLALILYKVADLQPLAPIVPRDEQGRPLVIPANNNNPHNAIPSPPQPPLPVHIYRGVKQGENETLRLSTPVTLEQFGVMEHRVANVLAPLLGDGYAGTGVTNEKRKLWCEASVVRRGERNPMMLPLHLLLFARPLDVPSISDILAEKSIYLEHPQTYSPALHNGYRYSNPHNPAPGGGVGEAERRRQHLLGQIQYRGPVRAQDVARQQVDQVFQNLKSGLDLDELTPPGRLVSTKLYPHQKQALSFLVDRERLVTFDPETRMDPSEDNIVSLWKMKLDTYSRKCVGWMNLVAEMELKGPMPPPQARGSILADDMGLGKTIVVISLIAETLEEAGRWALEGPPDKEKTDQRVEAIAVDKSKPRGGPAGAGMVVETNQFSGNLYGTTGVPLDAYGLSGGGDGLGRKKEGKKQKEAKLRREKKREEILASRHARLVTRSRATLIVCPLSTVQNWESQIEEHMNKDADVSVYVYHGNSRLSDPEKLADFDVVITTFSTLGTEYSRQTRAEVDREEEEERKAEESSDDGLEVFDSEGNLLEKPIKHELMEDEASGKGKRKRKRKKVEGSGASPLQQVQWFRVVLDEAHIIKEHSTIQARAACDLAASRRTALSGTPLQNSLNDLFSLVRFLRLEPFTDRAIWNQHIGNLAKTGDPLGVSRLQLIMRHLSLRRTKDSKDKEGKPILTLPPNNQKIVHLAFDSAEHAFYKTHHQRYKHDFSQLVDTDSVMKNYCSILQELLRLRQICVHMSLVRDSEDLAGEGDLSSSIDKHGISKPRAISLLALLRDSGSGQCVECGHDMVPVSAAAGIEQDDLANVSVDRKPPKKSRKATKSATASAACSDSEEAAAAPANELKLVVTRCQHLFCRLCFRHKVYQGWPQVVAPDDRAACSICKAELTPAIDAVEIGTREMELAFEAAEKRAQEGSKAKATRLFEHSTKTKALIADVFPFSQANPASANYCGGGEELDETKEEQTGGTIGFQPVKGEVVKSVVFSQWTKLLDRIGDALEQQNIKYGRLDGGMNRDQRSQAMEMFKADPACEVLLVSLRAGGVGLNLTAGRRVYLMEPFWNPAVENQAIDRIHRLGQTMPVQTIRYIIQNSIEQNMLKIQQRKMELANMSIGQTLSKSELARRRLEDLKLLMS
ncbi:hypothetical protein T439DRAFT_376672 [Meredithblackwellia eburnea MCA 4105]